MSAEKTCATCGAIKPLESFYRDRRASDGRQSRCKPCHERGKADWDRRNRDTINAQKRRLYARNRQRINHQTVRWQKENPEKFSAHRKVSRAIKAGKLERPNCCEECGQECFAQAHHDDYSRPLDVHWLCPRCHSARHKVCPDSPEESQ
jgi:hypothetical protein